MDLNEEIAKILDTYGEAIVDASRQSLANSRKVATGNLSDSIQYEVVPEGLNIWAATYLKYQEDGRRPNAPMPPIGPILEWIKAKNITPEGITSRQVTNKKTGKTRTRRDGVDIAQKRAAFAIAKSIAKDGFPGTGIIRPVLNEIKDPLYDAIGQAVANVFGDAIAEDWKNASTDQVQITTTFNK